MKLSNLLFLGLMLAAMVSSAQSGEDAIVGNWNAKAMKVEVYKSGDRYIGNPLGPDGKRNEEVEILNLTYKDNQWVGQLFAVKRERLFDVVCEVEGEKIVLNIDAGVVSREVEWTRIN